jgi:hypothetical protein
VVMSLFVRCNDVLGCSVMMSLFSVVMMSRNVQ